MLTCLILGIGWYLYAWYEFFHAPLLKTNVFVRLPKGAGFDSLLSTLVDQKILKSTHFFKLYAEGHADKKKLKAGEYYISNGMTAPQLLKNITAAKVYRHQITFVEGWTFEQILQALNHANLQHEVKSPDQVMTLLHSRYPHPEGLFFPDTYYYYWGQTDIDILKKAYDKMEKVLTDLWATHEKTLPYHTVYQALIVASLIEKETALAEERSLIAGVIVNRLRQWMRLQIDPSTTYGLKLKQNLNIKENAYNTYQHYGLPPTPIAMPSLPALFAAMHPIKTDYLYYVSKGDGSHQFSFNYQDHLKAIHQYLAKKGN